LSAFKADESQALAYTFLELNVQARNVFLVFFGFYRVLMGYLAFKLTFLPRLVGVLMACAGLAKLSAERALHIDHLFARMQRLNAYEAKTNAMTRIGSILTHVLPLPFRCE
jgi:hypothetical protein